MRKLTLIAAALALGAGSALAGPMPPQPAAPTPSAVQQQAPMSSVTIPADLADSIYLHLTQGGTVAASQRLAVDLARAAAEPMREMALRRQIEQEVKSAATTGPSGTTEATPTQAAKPQTNDAPSASTSNSTSTLNENSTSNSNTYSNK